MNISTCIWNDVDSFIKQFNVLVNYIDIYIKHFFFLFDRIVYEHVFMNVSLLREAVSSSLDVDE